jgi:hypothetical protein
MKKLSDYKGEDAIELWANLLDPFVEIAGDKKIATMLRAQAPPLVTAKEIIKSYKKEACQILLTIDDTPLNGLNILVRLAGIINEIINDEELKPFFASAADQEGEKPSGSVTANTEESES